MLEPTSAADTTYVGARGNDGQAKVTGCTTCSTVFRLVPKRETSHSDADERSALRSEAQESEYERQFRTTPCWTGTFVEQFYDADTSLFGDVEGHCGERCSAVEELPFIHLAGEIDPFQFTSEDFRDGGVYFGGHAAATDTLEGNSDRTEAAAGGNSAAYAAPAEDDARGFLSGVRTPIYRAEQQQSQNPQQTAQVAPSGVR